MSKSQRSQTEDQPQQSGSSDSSRSSRRTVSNAAMIEALALEQRILAQEEAEDVCIRRSPEHIEALEQAEEQLSTTPSSSGGFEQREWWGVGLLNQVNPETGSNINAMYIGADNFGEGTYGIEAGMFRGTANGQVGPADLSGTMNVFNAQATAGLTGPDGSQGFYASAGATAIGVEGTIGNGATELTGGVGFGPTLGVGAGVRDNDQDGRPEICSRVETPVATLGACLEDNMETPPEIIEAAERARSTGVYIPPPRYRNNRSW
jgi:hypothetical protein